MTLVHIDLRLPDEVTPAAGTVYFAPSRRLNVDTYTILPTPILVPLENGVAEVDLRPTDGSWAWTSHERTSGGKRRAFFVPDAPTAEYNALTDVELATLSPQAQPVAAWWTALNDLELSGGDAALANHINADTPHQTYDNIPDLTLIFQNGLI